MTSDGHVWSLQCSTESSFSLCVTAAKFREADYPSAILKKTDPGKALETAQAHLLMHCQENPHIRVERGARGCLIDVDTCLPPKTGQASQPCLLFTESPFILNPFMSGGRNHLPPPELSS